MNDTLTTNQSQEKDVTLWEELKNTTPTKNDASPTTQNECDITTEINALKEKDHWIDITTLRIIINNHYKIKRMSGIYKIINKTNGKYYIGKAANVYSRFKWEHVVDLNKNQHHNKYLQNSWNKYGQENFECFLIEKVPVDNLTAAEQKYLDIAKLDGKHKCYNIDMTSEGRGYGENNSKYIKLDDVTYNAAKNIWITGGGVALKAFIRSMGISIHKRLASEFRLDLKAYETAKSNSRIRKIKRNTGKIISEVTRNKIRKTLTGTIMPTETKLKISMALTGKVRSKEHIRNVGIANRDNSIYKFTNNKLNIEFIGTRFDFIHQHNINDVLVSNLINRKSKFTMTGWIFLGEVK